MEELTLRERQVLALIAEGKTSKEIAFQLGTAFRTAVCHRYQIMNKLGVHNAAELIRVAVQNGLLDLAPGQTATEAVAAKRGMSREPLLSQLDALFEENRRWRQMLTESLTISRAACERAEDYREQLKKTVEGTKMLSISLKLASGRQMEAA